jgi:predicted transport protein
MTLEEFFAGWDDSFQLFEVLRKEIEMLGPAEMRVQKSQVSFRRARPFAFVWIPGKTLHRKAALLVLTLGFCYRDDSPRWKEIVEPHPGRFTHHLELYSVEEIDDQVRSWLKAAWDDAG